MALRHRCSSNFERASVCLSIDRWILGRATAECLTSLDQIKQQFDAIGDTQLLKTPKEVVLHGMLAEPQFPRNRLVRLTSCRTFDHLQFTKRQRRRLNRHL